MKTMPYILCFCVQSRDKNFSLSIFSLDVWDIFLVSRDIFLTFNLVLKVFELDKVIKIGNR